MSLYQVSSGDRILAADLNQFYSILKGVAASGESVSLIYNAAGALILQPSSDPAVGTQLYQLKNNAGTVKAAMTAGGGALFSSQVLLAQSSNIVAAATTDLSTATGNYVSVTGTTTITALGTVQAGTLMFVEFAGALTLTHNGTSLILRDATNYFTAAGDVFAFMSEGSGNWREVSRSPATTPPSQDLFNLSYWYWMPGFAIESTLTGTGAYSALTNFSYGQLSCGATSGSNVGLRKGMNAAFGTGTGGTAEMRWWSFLFATDKAANEAFRLFITDESVTGQPSLTAKHLGVRFDGATVSFSTADGATEQTTDISAFVSASTDYHCVVTFDGTTARLYIDGTLRATHATNVPTAAAGVIPIFRAHITNSAAADKNLYIGPMHVRAVA